ncbi:MAG: LamG-like jellyroll fold domain-containing protein [Phycisphaerales bacterium]
MNYIILSLALGLVITTGSFAAPATDDSTTVALWHMDSAAGSLVSDDDAVTPGRNNDLTLTGPAITSGVQGHYGEALSFDGTDDKAQGVWTCADNILIDGWFKPGNITANLEKSLVSVNNIILLKFQLNKCWLMAYNKEMVTPGVYKSISAAADSNTWFHIVASVDKAGAMSLRLYNADGSLRSSASGNTPGIGGLHQNLTTMSPLWLGNRNNTFYSGLMDDLKISTAKASAPNDDAETFSLVRMDSATDGRVYDDDPCNTTRDNDLVFSPDPCTPTITTGGQGYYGEALSFDGTQTATFVQKWNKYSTFKADLWIRPFNLGASSDYKEILSIPGQARLFMKNGTIQLWVKNKANSTYLTVVAQAASMVAGQWNHIVATIEPNGHSVLTTSNGTFSGYTNDGGWYLGAGPRVFVVGGQEGSVGGVANHFEGLIDELKISNKTIPCNTRGYPTGDFNQDCQVDFADFASMAENWMKCTIPGVAECVNLN